MFNNYKRIWWWWQIMGFRGNSILIKSLFDIGYCIYSVQGILFESKDTGWGFYIKLNYLKNCFKTRQVAYRSSKVSEWLMRYRIRQSRFSSKLKTMFVLSKLVCTFFISQPQNVIQRTDQVVTYDGSLTRNAPPI